MRLPLQVRWAGLEAVVIVALTVIVASQQSAKTKPAEAPKAVKAESVTINMPEGMTKDQADAILSELKAIPSYCRASKIPVLLLLLHHPTK